MLGNLRMMTILPVVQMERARHFYRDVLGLAEAGRSADGKYVFATASGGLLALMEKPNATPRAHHIAVSFEVESTEATVSALVARGVTFEDYDLPGLRTVEKICVLGTEKAAWFRDPDGHMICVYQTLIPVASAAPADVSIAGAATPLRPSGV